MAVPVFFLMTVLPVVGKTQPPPAVQELSLETSDGIRVAAWYYPAATEATPTATVILVHDLGGSHATVEDLARALQKAGCAVVAPDLRWHGSSRPRAAAAGASGPGRSEAAAAPQVLRKADFEAMAASAGGRVRDQASQRGDLEAVRHWIRQQADAGKLDIDRLCIVGSGLGATLAAMWVAADWNWPPTTAGPQGRQVRAIALVSPAMTQKGLPMTAPLASEALRSAVPVLVLAGTGDRDAGRVFDQFKKYRPKEWFQQRADQTSEKARELDAPGDASVFFIQCKTTLSGDKLVTDPTINASDQIKNFFGMALARKPD